MGQGTVVQRGNSVYKYDFTENQQRGTPFLSFLLPAPSSSFHLLLFYLSLQLLLAVETCPLPAIDISKVVGSGRVSRRAVAPVSVDIGDPPLGDRGAEDAEKDKACEEEEGEENRRTRYQCDVLQELGLGRQGDQQKRRR